MTPGKPTRAKAVALANKALALSADCADAYSFLADLTAGSVEEAIELYAKGFQAGERALGKELFKKGVGHFWGILETRPYMRARAGLAGCLWSAGRREEAVPHYQALLMGAWESTAGALERLAAAKSPPREEGA